MIRVTCHIDDYEWDEDAQMHVSDEVGDVYDVFVHSTAEEGFVTIEFVDEDDVHTEVTVAVCDLMHAIANAHNTGHDIDVCDTDHDTDPGIPED